MFLCEIFDLGGETMKVVVDLKVHFLKFAMTPLVPVPTAQIVPSSLSVATTLVNVTAIEEPHDVATISTFATKHNFTHIESISQCHRFHIYFTKHYCIIRYHDTTAS